MQVDPARIVLINSINSPNTPLKLPQNSELTTPAQPMRNARIEACGTQKLVSLSVFPQFERSNGFNSEGLRRLFGMNQGANSDYTMMDGSPTFDRPPGAGCRVPGAVRTQLNTLPADLGI